MPFRARRPRPPAAGLLWSATGRFLGTTSICILRNVTYSARLDVYNPSGTCGASCWGPRSPWAKGYYSRFLIGRWRVGTKTDTGNGQQLVAAVPRYFVKPHTRIVYMRKIECVSYFRPGRPDSEKKREQGKKKARLTETDKRRTSPPLAQSRQ